MEDSDHREVIRRLFMAAGLRLEAMTSAAGGGQASAITASQATELAGALITGAQELSALGYAIALLADGM